MLILIRKSELFTIDPDIRFANKYKVSRGIWKEMWRRHIVLDYSVSDLADYYELKTKKRISRQNVKRWLNRTIVFIKIKPIIEMGADAVKSDLFMEMEDYVIKELTKNLKASVKKEAKVLP